MNEQNPYTAPESESIPVIQGDASLSELSFEQLKKFYHRSSNINAIAFLTGIGAMVLLALFVMTIKKGDTHPYEKFIYIGVAIYYVVAVVGLYKRTSWGRILGVIVCIISLIQIPIGTLIGIIGLFAFFGSPELFGADRLTHKGLKAEFKLQKLNRKKGELAGG